MTATVKYKDHASVAPATIDFNIVVVHPCAEDTLTIDPAIFIPTLLTYNLYSAASDFTFTDSAAISANSLTTCGDLDWTIT